MADPQLPPINRPSYSINSHAHKNDSLSWVTIQSSILVLSNTFGSTCYPIPSTLYISPFKYSFY